LAKRYASSGIARTPNTKASGHRLRRRRIERRLEGRVRRRLLEAYDEEDRGDDQEEGEDRERDPAKGSAERHGRYSLEAWAAGARARRSGRPVPLLR
jgi:hypothetical protein